MPQIIFKRKPNKDETDYQDPQHTVLQSNTASRASSFNLNSSKKINRSKSSLGMSTSKLQQKKSQQQILTNSQNANRLQDFKLYKDNNIDSRLNQTNYDGQQYLDQFYNTQILGSEADQSIMKQDNHVYYDNALLNSSFLPAQNLMVKQRQRALDKKLDSLVLFDPLRMFRGEQNLRVQDMLKSGKQSILAFNNMKRNRLNSTTTQNKNTVNLNASIMSSSTSNQLPNLDFAQHMYAFQNSLKPFYKQSKIVPEHMLDDQHKNKECYILQEQPRSQQQQRRNTTASTRLSYSSQGQMRNKLQSSEAARQSQLKKIDHNQYEYESNTANQQNQQMMIQNQMSKDSQPIDAYGTPDILKLKKKFEDNESNIIHELYSKHFQHSQTPQIQYMDSTIKHNKPIKNEVSAINENQEESSNSHQLMENYLTNPADSLSLTDNNTLGIHDSIQKQNEKYYDKVKYVQYIPKHLRGSDENIINQMYLSTPDNQTITSANPFNSIPTGEQRCHSQHQHIRRCHKYKELDVADIQNQAFQKLKVQNTQIFEKKEDRNYKASFFPASQLPEELKQILKQNQEFQNTMLIDDKLLLARPNTNIHTQSRFYHKDNVLWNADLQHQEDEYRQDQQDQYMRESERNILLMQRRQQLQQKAFISRDRKHDETYDSNQVDPEQLNQQEQFLINYDPSSQLDIQAIALQHYATAQNKNYYYPKVSILNNFNGSSQDSKFTQHQQHVQSQDFSQTPISQNNLKLNIQKECVKYHHNNIASQQILVLSSHRHSDDGIIVNQQSPQHPVDNHNFQVSGTDNLTQNIFRPRNLMSQGSSQYLSPVTQLDTNQQVQQIQNKTRQNEKKQIFYNFNEINKLQNKKWQSPYVHQKNCDLIKKINLKSSELQNFEKSKKVQQAQSLNASHNNHYQLWNRNNNKSNLQTRKRKSLQVNVIESIEREQSNQNQRKKGEKVQGNEDMMTGKKTPSSLMAFKLKRYQRPNTTQLQRVYKNLSHQGMNTLDIDQTQVQVSSLGDQITLKDTTFQMETKNHELRLDTDSISMSSGNINVTVSRQQSLKQTHKNEGNKRLIISKRRGEFNAKKPRLTFHEPSKISNQSDNLNLTQN